MVKYLKEDKHGNIRTIDIWDKYEFYCMNDCLSRTMMEKDPEECNDMCKTLFCSKCFIKRFLKYIEKPIVKEEK